MSGPKVDDSTRAAVDWLLRLEARLLPRAGEVVTMKDPEHFRRMLERFRLAPEALPR